MCCLASLVSLAPVLAWRPGFLLLADAQVTVARLDVGQLWRFLVCGYFLSIAIETPVLLVGLSRPHPWRRRLAAGFWLTACTYPVVVVALPILMASAAHWQYLAVAETFAPLTEGALFALAFHTPAVRRADRVQDWLVILLANLASFGLGWWFDTRGWLWIS